MGKNEQDVSAKQLTLPEREYWQRERHHRQVLLGNGIAAFLSLVTININAFAIVRTLDNNEQQLRQSSTEFQVSSRDNHYNQIISGLQSSAAAVQANSMRLLTEFIEDRSELRERPGPTRGRHERDPDPDGVHRRQQHRSGQTRALELPVPCPHHLSRAMARLRAVLENQELGSTEQTSVVQTCTASRFRTSNPVARSGCRSRLRRASLRDLDVRAAPAELTAAFLTCSDLTAARFGEANVNNEISVARSFRAPTCPR